MRAIIFAWLLWPGVVFAHTAACYLEWQSGEQQVVIAAPDLGDKNTDDYLLEVEALMSSRYQGHTRQPPREPLSEVECVIIGGQFSSAKANQLYAELEH